MTTQYFHQARYGNLGQTHTMRPTMVMKGGHVYTTAAHPMGASAKPIFEERGGKLYATVFHPSGHGAHAHYDIRGTNVHTTVHHPEHNHAQSHVYDLKLHE